MYILPLNMIQSLSQKAKSVWAMCYCFSLKCVLGGSCWETIGECHRWEMVGFVHSCVISKLIDWKQTQTEQICVVLKDWTFFRFPLEFLFSTWKWTYSISVETPECKCNFPWIKRSPHKVTYVYHSYPTNSFFNGINKSDNSNISSGKGEYFLI